VSANVQLTKTDLTKRQQEVLERLELGYPVKRIATDIGVSRNAVYQTIERLRRHGALPDAYTPSGQPPRRDPAVGSVVLGGRGAVAPRESALPRLRELDGERDRGSPAYAELVERAIADGDATALAYELGRIDAGGESGFAAELIESALRRLGALPSADGGE
jgi:transposase-like protein